MQYSICRRYPTPDILPLLPIPDALFISLLGGLAGHLEFRTLSSRHLSPSLHISGSRDGSSASDTRDEDALRQTLETLSGTGDLEDFVDGIPGYLLEHGAGAIIMQWFLSDKDIGFGTRIIQQLRLSGYQDAPQKLKRTISCYCWQPEIPESEVEDWFDDEALPVLETFEYKGPIIGYYLSSTIAMFLATLLDSYLSSAISIERELTQLGVERPWSTFGPWNEQLRVQRHLCGSTPHVNSGCIMAMKAWLRRLRCDFAATKAEFSKPPFHPTPAMDEFMQSSWSFQTLVNEARITVFNNFVPKLLSDYPLYEILLTFYQLIIDTNLGLSVSLHNQACLVDLLKEYDQLPTLTIDHLLDVVSILMIRS